MATVKMPGNTIQIFVVQSMYVEAILAKTLLTFSSHGSLRLTLAPG